MALAALDILPCCGGVAPCFFLCGPPLQIPVTKWARPTPTPTPSPTQDASSSHAAWLQESMRLKVKAEDAQRASESKSNFLAVMSHEACVPGGWMAVM
jgi:hypothetical protein